jgi:hypothetical protein
MGWERRRKKRCLYRTRRVAGGFARDYLGFGPVADIAGTAAGLARTQRQVLSEKREIEQERQAAIEAQLADLAEWAACLASVVPVLRSLTLKPNLRTAPYMIPKTKPDAAEPLGIDDLQRTASAASAGDHEALAKLRRLLDTHSVVWRSVADLTARTEAMLIQQAAGHEQLLTESLLRKIAEMKVELVGDKPSLLDRLLAGQVVSSWLHVQIAEAALVAASNQTQADRGRKALTAANRTQLDAIELLAQVRESQGSRPGADTT